MAPISNLRRTLDTAVLQSLRERHISFPATNFPRSRAKRIFRQNVARIAATVSRNDGNNIRASCTGHIKLGASRVATRNIALDYCRSNCIRAVDDLFFRHIIPQRAKSSVTRDSL
jgi:hypothetical protein